MTSINWKSLAEKSIEGQPLTESEARSILQSKDDELLELVSAGRRIRETFFGKKVKVNYLVNVKSGICPEDCHYCSQSKDSKAPIEKYPLMNALEIIRHAEMGMEVGASRACLVASGRGPNEKDLNQFCDAVQKLKATKPELEVCACLGLLEEGQAEKLKAAGVDAYNHNINTSSKRYEEICGTHGLKDREDTIQRAQQSGLSSCSGVLTGMGESDDELIEMAFSLREKKAESIPVNFLIPIDNTPMAGKRFLSPEKCLRILALFKFVNPTAELRIAGGRELNLGWLQPLGLYLANSIFIGDYLTTKGQSPWDDLRMIRDLGYSILGQPDDFLDKTLQPSSPELKEKEKALV